MKILFQSLIEMGRTPAYFSGMQARAAAISRPGVEVDFVGMPAGIYGSNAPSEVLKYPYMAAMTEQFILDNALRAEAEGYDVFAIGSVQDPGLEQARALVDIPVVGYGESAMHFACCLSTRFAVLVFEKGFDQMMDLRIQRLGLASRALPTVVVDADFEQVSRGLTEGEKIVSAFTRAARRAIEDGAEAIIPGQLYLSEAIVRAGLTRIDEAPIIDGLSANLKMAEAMADLKSLGIGVTRRGYQHARPPSGVVEHARRFQKRDEIAADLLTQLPNID
ncbi:aspartate/glutamate racemase family protein [Bordetella sp. BOR01]|uniref:aspartate/glutamate racemase family protein n=1 Tax=Bordetella sp. BOR01 TaxID=2854779 RepID=UPI001C460D3A|nr:aspartate/glutamate racemase family protein [Bordetella sp. BOR01]MBV7484073.1 aspartate/glutamate racemase family protein [Bordetella sp. BOR01]